MSTLFVAATPIGNLSDATPRLVETLRQADLIVAEDTRVTGNLLRHFGIRRPLTSLHRHNEAEKAERIVRRMLGEEMAVALVTDAGTPAISDPGYYFVQFAAREGIEVLAIAGPCAAAAALSLSGFDAREFAFYGFLPRERSEIRKKLLQLSAGPKVAIFYESPHRILTLLETIEATLPGCSVSVSCELTKKHEKTIRGNPLAAMEQIAHDPYGSKGEYCVVLDMSGVSLPGASASKEVDISGQLFSILLSGASRQEAIELAVEMGIRKNDAKRALIAIQNWVAKERIS